MKAVSILAHPAKESTISRLWVEATKGIESAGVENAKVNLYELKLDFLLYPPDLSNKIAVPKQEREAGLIELDRMIADAQGILIAYPGWWNNMPGILKCFFDRVEFKTGPDGAPIKTWDGKKGLIITGGGAPFFVRKFLFRNQAFNSVNYVLKSLGTRVAFKLICDGIPKSSNKKKETWVKRARITGEKFGRSLK